MRVHLKVKFRAFGITFGSIDEWFTVELGMAPPPIDIILYDRRGVYLRLVIGG